VSIATLDGALGDSQRVLVDSSAIIALHTSTDRVHALAEHLFSRIQDSDDSLVGYYSVVSAAEVLVRPIRSGPNDYAYMHAFLRSFPNLHELPVDFEVALQAANLRAAHNLRTPDAMIVASGLLAGVESIATGDESWGRRLQPMFPGFTWLYLPSHV